jgi:hypothetical protein
MAESLRRSGVGLDFEVAKGVDNLSVAPRQFICIGSAVERQQGGGAGRGHGRAHAADHPADVRGRNGADLRALHVHDVALRQDRRR